MKIEDKWSDGFLYFIEFQVLQGGFVRTFKKNIVLFEELEKQEIVELIKATFNEVDTVVTIDYFTDVLSIK